MSSSNDIMMPPPPLPSTTNNNSTDDDTSSSSHTIRPLSLELGTLHGCDGSAVYKSGHTSVLAAVHGPTAPRQTSLELADRARVSVAVHSGPSSSSSVTPAASAGGNSHNSNNGSGTTNTRELETFLIRQISGCVCTTEYPRTVVSLVVHVVHADGSVWAAALHAAVSALLDASIAMTRLPTAVTCAWMRKKESDHVPQHPQHRSGTTDTTDRLAAPPPSSSDMMVVLDPTADQEHRAQGVLVLVYASSQQKLLACQSTTASLRQTSAQLLQCSATAVRAVPAIQAFWRLAVEQKVTRESETLWST